jgi:hypothetical protein
MILNSIYTVVMILTFGWIAANHGGCAYKTESPQVCRVMTASLGAVAWPAYWSWVVFDAASGK